MKFRLTVFHCSAVLLAFSAVPGAARERLALQPRERNNTLRLPGRIPVAGYGLVNAFPGVTFNQPIALAAPPAETNRLFVVERTGAIYVITNLAEPNKTIFLDLSQQVNALFTENGLLGLVFHPGFATNRFFFVFRTMSASTPGAPNRPHDVVSRFEVSRDNSNLGLTNSEVTILAQLDDSDQHNGGDLKFGPDGYLYVSIGERVYRDPNWPDQTPVDRDLQGAILRIDVDGLPGNLPPNPHPASTTHYWIPADNPFVGITQHHGLAVNPPEVRTELYATGFRNPWRIAFDPVSGDLYAADVGEADQEEIDLVVPGGDYGWPYFEGSLASGYPAPSEFNPRPPLHAYPHGWSGGTNGDCVIGGVVYRGHAMPWLQGRYLFADFFSGYLRSLQRQGDSVAVERLVDAPPGATAFGSDPRDGEILVAFLLG
jgi:glucose/arabinose dehydrogenase